MICPICNKEVDWLSAISGRCRECVLKTQTK